ncbi:MAG: LapA family protein [Kovacikia sp.]
MLFRLILLLAIVGGFVLFTGSNLQPLSLIFLGIQMPALPLAFWVLGAIGAGVLTTLAISILFNLSHYVAGRAVRSQFKQSARGNRFQGFRRDRFATTPNASSSSPSAPAKDDDTAWKNWEGYETPLDHKRAESESVNRNNLANDWETDVLEDWDDEVTDRTPANPSGDFLGDRPRAEPFPRNRANYEVSQEPKTSSRSGSVYSYGYRDPGTSGVGKAESTVDKPALNKPIVDADYRVIVPPYRSLDEDPTVPTDLEPRDEENADDWFEDDRSDDFRDRERRS